jgi:hypothetical protein
MGDAGEALVDAESRIQERMEERERERTERVTRSPRDPEPVRALEALRLARLELANQLKNTGHPRRREMLVHALDELDRRIADAAHRAGHAEGHLT